MCSELVSASHFTMLWDGLIDAMMSVWGPFFTVTKVMLQKQHGLSRHITLSSITLGMAIKLKLPGIKVFLRAKKLIYRSKD